MYTILYNKSGVKNLFLQKHTTDMDIQKLLFTGLSALMILSCTGNAEQEKPDGTNDDNGSASQEYDWDSIADAAQNSLEMNFWRGDSFGYYWIDNIHDDASFNHYWQTAHAMETLMDAYERTKDTFFKDRVRNVLARIKQSTSGEYINEYYDDMSWMGLACLRAYSLFGEEEYVNAAKILWNEVQTGWTGDGMLWNKIPDDSGKRNACTHWTAACFGAEMYGITGDSQDLSLAVKIYDWAYGNLYDTLSGATFDQVGSNVYTTYNQGVLIGASLKLYGITGTERYLNTAEKCADFCIDNDKFAKAGIWRDEGASGTLNRNNGIFKGILAHYMTGFIRSSHISTVRRKVYIQYMEKMGVTLYEAAKNDLLFPGDWTRGAEAGERIYLGCELSGVILMECNAIFSREYPDLLQAGN